MAGKRHAWLGSVTLHHSAGLELVARATIGAGGGSRFGDIQKHFGMVVPNRHGWIGAVHWSRCNFYCGFACFDGFVWIRHGDLKISSVQRHYQGLCKIEAPLDKLEWRRRQF